MKITNLVTTGIILASSLFLGACGTSSSGSDSTTTAADPSAAYLTAIGATSPDFASVNPAFLITLGKGVCSDFQQGATMSQVEADALGALNSDNNQTDLSAADFGTIIGGAIKYFCPAYLGQAS